MKSTLPCHDFYGECLWVRYINIFLRSHIAIWIGYYEFMMCSTIPDPNYPCIQWFQKRCTMPLSACVLVERSSFPNHEWNEDGIGLLERGVWEGGWEMKCIGIKFGTLRNNKKNLKIPTLSTRDTTLPCTEIRTLGCSRVNSSFSQLNCRECHVLVCFTAIEINSGAH